ncbi:MAG: STAS domain-containing protein [Alkalispirochaetaceae bacterium]
MADSGEYPVVFLLHEDDLIVFFRGSVTANHSYALYQQLATWLTEKPVEHVFLDLHLATYIDSTTVGTLIKIHKLQRSLGKRCVLINLSRSVKEILGQMKLLGYFRIAEDENTKELEDRVVEQIPVEQQERVSSEFVLDTHHDIVNIVPELRGEFETLLKALENATGRDEER